MRLSARLRSGREKLARLTPWQSVLLAVLVVLVVASLWISVKVFEGGILSVSVAGDCIPGGRIQFAVPGFLLWTLMPVVVPEDARVEMAEHAHCWMPITRVALAELQRCPDFVLASVETPAERVRVEKRGRHLLFLIDADEVDIRAKIPLGSLRLMLQSLAPHTKERRPTT
jgi:hypothetical protein